MDWTESIRKAIEYIEEHITEDITANDVASYVAISTFYFQKGFCLLCGYTVMEYIRNRRLALAGNDVATGTEKIITIALKYGYDSPDSFTKAFARFHGVTPSMVQKNSTMLKTFAPLKIKLSLEGGYKMDYQITKKESFTVAGVSRRFAYEGAKEAIPEFWKDLYKNGHGKQVCGMFGVNINVAMGSNEFEYLIADVYRPQRDIPEGLITKTIPAFTWAVFPCKGPMPEAMQDAYAKIFSEWLPALKNYEIAAGYCIEIERCMII